MLYAPATLLLERLNLHDVAKASVWSTKKSVKADESEAIPASSHASQPYYLKIDVTQEICTPLSIFFFGPAYRYATGCNASLITFIECIVTRRLFFECCGGVSNTSLTSGIGWHAGGLVHPELTAKCRI
jgi:hypothetical protein